MNKLSYRMINIGNRPAGLLGVEELFSRLYNDSCGPEDSDTGDRVIRGISRYNFIPLNHVMLAVSALSFVPMIFML